jgi:hypothetical protein
MTLLMSGPATTLLTDNVVLVLMISLTLQTGTAITLSTPITLMFIQNNDASKFRRELSSASYS